MKASLNWLKDYVNVDKYTDKELYDLISFHICEIEDYSKLINATNLMIGYVKDCIAHPDSDHLHVCQVELLDGVSQIVCGAPNVSAGQKVIVALPGAVLPGDFKIKPSKIRGVESFGMICSLQELGLEEKYIKEEFKNGIFILDNDAPVGGDPLKYLGYDDTVIDLDLTSNRSDLLSIEGIAYDLGATLHQTIKPIIPVVEEVSVSNPVKVRVETPKCYKYLSRYVRNVKIKESPLWMKARLISSGVRPINNVVDITNYVMLEMGQPLHAFDADKLGNSIVVRNAKANEVLKTLDGIERKLCVDDIVITNGANPLCVAGIMGGEETEVTNDTTNVVLESAYFEPLCIRKTSTRLGLKSESSIRFERKVDYQRVDRALDRAAELLVSLADGEVLKGISKAITNEIKSETVSITTTKINSVLGTNLSKETVKGIFDDLAYDYCIKDEVFIITIPSRRMDLEPSIQDIIEDVVRMYGYDNVPTTLAATSTKGYLTSRQRKIRNIRRYLSDLGLNETISYSLVSKKSLYNFTLEELKPIEILMPMTEDKAVMRQSLLNGLLDAIEYNKARKADNLAFFEIGKKYFQDGEQLLLAGAMTGVFEEKLWAGYKQNVDFFVLKGVLDSLFEYLGFSVEYVSTSEANSNFHPGRCAYIVYNGKNIGVIGEIHPRYAKNHDLNDTYVFELNLEQLLSEDDHDSLYNPINKFPTVTRDLAVVVDKKVTAGDIVKIVKQTARKNLVDIQIFDLYEGNNVGENEKSIAIKLTLEDKMKTLEANDVEKIIKSVLNRLDYNFKARLR